jgi:hypothetical protein
MAAAILALGLIGPTLASTAAMAVGPHIPDVPTLPSVPPDPSDILAVMANIKFNNTPMHAGDPVTGSYTLAGSCTTGESFGDPIPDLTAPSCSIASNSGGYTSWDQCLDGSLSDNTGTAGVASNEMSLTSMKYRIEWYAGIGFLSGSAMERDASEYTAATLSGIVVLTYVPSLSPPNNCLAGIQTMQLAGEISIVETAIIP